MGKEPLLTVMYKYDRWRLGKGACTTRKSFVVIVVKRRNKHKNRGNTRKVGFKGRFWAARVKIQD